MRRSTCFSFSPLSPGLLLFFTACGQPSPIDDELTRANIKGGTPARAYAASCLVDIYDRQNKLVALCSGSMIAPSVLITAGHCVSGYDRFRVACPYLGQEAWATGEAHPTYHTGPNNGVAPDSNDVGLVYLQSRILMPSYPVVRSSPVADSTPVVNVGRVLDGVVSRTELYQSPVIKVQDARSISFPNDYVSDDKIQPGDSGGPTYRFHAPADEIVAVNSGAGDGFAVLARVDLVYGWINERVNQQGGWTLPPGYQPLVPHAPDLIAAQH